MSRRRRLRHRNKEEPEINITAFMNLMVVLIPFLLMLAVFTHLSVLELNLPELGDSNPKKKDKPKFDLQITIRKNYIDISDTVGGLIKRVNKTKEGKYDFAEVSDKLAQIKLAHKDKSNATILAEKNTDYDTLIQTMDAVRMQIVTQDKVDYQVDLFPEISIGDAPR